MRKNIWAADLDTNLIDGHSITRLASSTFFAADLDTNLIDGHLSIDDYLDEMQRAADLDTNLIDGHIDPQSIQPFLTGRRP